MHIERPHQLGQAEAIRRIDTFLDNLMQRPLPGGVTIQDPSKTWAGHVMTFSFKAKKGWVGATIAGTLRVEEQTVVLDSALPGMVTAFLHEDQIRASISEQLDGILRK